MVDIHSATAEIRRGKNKEEERKKKPDKNIMSASAMQGGHNYLIFNTVIVKKMICEWFFSMHSV